MNKIVLLGPTGAGKTQLYYCFIGEDECSSTPSIGTSSQKIKLENEDYWIYDTAGQEQYQSLAFSYVRDASVVILVSDGSNDNFDKISKNYFEKVKEFSINARVINVMNKSDLLNDDAVRKANQRADEIAPGVRYYLISALNNDCVDDLKSAVVEECKKVKPQDNGNSNSVKITPGKSNGIQESCC